MPVSNVPETMCSGGEQMLSGLAVPGPPTRARGEGKVTVPEHLGASKEGGLTTPMAHSADQGFLPELCKRDDRTPS
jgi:hypothetical protein